MFIPIVPRNLYFQLLLLVIIRYHYLGSEPLSTVSSKGRKAKMSIGIENKFSRPLLSGRPRPAIDNYRAIIPNLTRSEVRTTAVVVIRLQPCWPQKGITGAG